MTILTNSNTSITVETGETDGSYPVKVYASNTCGSSAWEQRNVVITGTTFTVRETDLSGGGSRAYYDISQADVNPAWYDGTTYNIKWNLISSLGVRTDVTDYSYTPSTLTRTSFQGFVTGTMTTQALCTDVVVNTTGCLTRKCLGAHPIPGGNNFRSVSDPSEAGYTVNELTVYPNPAQTTVTVNIIGNKGSNVKLVDSNGNIVYKSYTEEEAFDLDVSAYRSGLYTLVVSGGKSDLSQKIVISK